jgi:hypothetical protein
MHYSTGLGGAQNTNGLMNILSKIAWQPEHLKLLEHAENIETVCGLLASQGVTIPEPIRVNYLLDSIERSGVTDYSKDIEEARRQNMSMIQVMSLLQRTASQVALLNKGYSYAAKPIRELSEHANLAAGAKTTMLNPKVSTACSLCNRTGHRAEECWSQVICAKCGKQGHVAQRCWESGEDRSTPVKTGVKFIQKLEKK